jgi:hypothetical protein
MKTEATANDLGLNIIPVAVDSRASESTPSSGLNNPTKTSLPYLLDQRHVID